MAGFMHLIDVVFAVNGRIYDLHERRFVFTGRIYDPDERRYCGQWPD